MATAYFLKQNISTQTIECFLQLGRIKSCPAHTTLLSMGEQSHEVYLILKGIVRGFYITEDGDDITKCFTAENQWCCVYNLLNAHPSAYWIETLEDSILLAFQVADILALIQKDAKAQQLYSRLFTEAFILSDARVHSLKDFSATERYLEFKKAYPTLEARIEQKYIASFLGITPSSLSRLKHSL